MGFDFHFRQGDPADIAPVIGFLAKQDLGYKGYQRWVAKSEAELHSGRKQVVSAHSGLHVVGNVVYQEHPDLTGAIEIRNIRVHPEVRDRHFARFMMRQVEAEHPGQPLLVDAREYQHDMHAFLLSCGYVPFTSISLYDSGIKDIVFVKTPSLEAIRPSLDEIFPSHL